MSSAVGMEQIVTTSTITHEETISGSDGVAPHATGAVRGKRRDEREGWVPPHVADLQRKKKKKKKKLSRSTFSGKL